MGSSLILDVEVEMHLLGCPVWPVGRYMVRGQLDTDAPLAGRIDHRVPVVFFEDVATKHTSPEGALGMQVGGIEHNYPAHHVHDTNTTSPTRRRDDRR